MSNSVNKLTELIKIYHQRVAKLPEDNEEVMDAPPVEQATPAAEKPPEDNKEVTDTPPVEQTTPATAKLPENNNKEVTDAPPVEHITPVDDNQIINVLLVRDEIHAVLKSGQKPTGEQLQLLIQADSQLYEYLDAFFKSRSGRPAEWRYYYPTVSEKQWWWFGDEYIYRTGDTIKHEPHLNWYLIFGVLFMTLGITFAAYTAQSLFRRELDLEAALSIISNVLWGGALATPTGLRLARGVMRMVLKQLQRLASPLLSLRNLFPGQSTVSQADSGIPERPSAGNFTFFAVANLFLLFALLVPPLVLTSASNIVFLAGQRAYERVDYSTARDLFTLSARLQPTTLPGFIQPDAAGRLTQLGLLYEQLGLPEEATTAYENALEHDGRIIVAQVPLANLYINSGRASTAQALTTQAIQLSQRYLEGKITLPTTQRTAEIHLVRAYIVRGRALLNSDLTNAAITNFERAQQEAGRLGVDDDTLYLTNLYRLWAYATVEDFQADAALSDTVTAQTCVQVLEDVKNYLTRALIISANRTAAPYDIWIADMNELNEWADTFDCTLSPGGGTEWPTRERY